MIAKYYIVEFKGYRRNCYYNYLDLPLKEGEYVVVQAERGEDLGKIVRAVPSLRLDETDQPLPNILRAAGNDDVDRLRFNRQKEDESFEDCLVRIEEKGLNMKLVDVEYQFDCNKITFYFTAERRVDFRELVKDLAAIYKTRIELRQIGVRDEAKRLGGFGCCGLQQCCSAWLNEFQPISTQLARDQGLSLNPSKISGNCGRLLCCLLYEQPVYEDMASQFPKVGSKCEGCQGNAVVTQVNYFKSYVVARYEDDFEERIPILEYRKKARLRRRGQLPDKPEHRENNNSNNDNKNKGK